MECITVRKNRLCAQTSQEGCGAPQSSSSAGQRGERERQVVVILGKSRGSLTLASEQTREPLDIFFELSHAIHFL